MEQHRLGECTYNKISSGCRLPIDLLHELWYEGDHTNKGIDCNQVGEDYH